MSIEKIDKKIEEIDSYLKHLDEIETNEYWDEMLEENEYEEKLAKGLVYLDKTENLDYKEEIKITPNAIKQALDDLLEENDMYKRENKHLKDLLKNMDKQYAELEEENYIANKTINELTKQIAKLVEDKKQLKERMDKAIEYINHFSKESEVKIYGLPKCKVFIGDTEQLLEILKEVE